ncbi:MAG: DUF6159 family protein [Holophagales bacterium]|nr:DUF6159 family protein [Holophagales bacterium]
MLQKLRNSWELVKASARVLEADKELMVFPAVSGIALVLVTATFFLPVYFFAGSTSVAAEGTGPLGWVLLFAFYVVQYSVIIFFNSALVGAALIRLDGGDPTLADGLRIARERLGAILGYAVIAATVGLLLRSARERSDNLLTKLAASLAGAAWSLATFLVVPVLVSRNVGPIDALKESASILKRTWGEQIAGNVGIGLIFGAAMLGLGLLALPAILLPAISGLPWLAVGAGVVFALAFLLVSLLNATLSGIYSAALYRYATRGDSRMFDGALLQNAFVPK